MDHISRSSTSASSGGSVERFHDLFKPQGWFPIQPWRETVFKFKDTARSFLLVEARLYKNEFNVEHEFVLGEFRAGSEVIFVAAERVTKYKDSDHKMSDEECHRTLEQLRLDDKKEKQEKRKQKGKEKKQTSKLPDLVKNNDGNLSTRLSSSSAATLSSVSSSVSDHTMRADDKIRAIRGVQNFEAAVKIITEERLKKTTKTIFASRGSLKYQFDTEPNAASTSISGNPLSTTSRPNLVNFTCAAFTMYRAKPYYTVGHKNCYWYATAMMFILSENFPPSEPAAFDKKQGTLTFGLLNVPLGGLEEGEGLGLLHAYTRTMQEMALTALPYKTGQEILAEQAKYALEMQLKDYNQLALEAKDKVNQAEKKEANAKEMHAKANAKVSEARSKAERLALQADLEEERESRLASEEQHRREIQELQARLNASESSNSK